MINFVSTSQRMVANKGSSGLAITFPDVCKTPTPSGLVPVPYPNAQLQSNLRKANLTDAKAKAGDTSAKKMQKQAIENLKQQIGVKVKSATAAVLMGWSVYKKSAGDEAGSSTSVISGRAGLNTNVLTGNQVEVNSIW
jgi:hypothetical protein